MNIGFYVSGKSNRLFKFLNQADEKIISSIKIVVSEYEIENELKGILKQKKIAYSVYEYKELPGNNNKEKNLELSNHIMEELDKNDIDYCFSFGRHLLSGELLKKYNHRLINFHPALLPMYPGGKAIDQAVEHGNTFLVGNTAHFIDAGMDTGVIIMQSVIPLQAFLAEKDYNVVLDIQIDMLNKLMEVLADGRLSMKNGRAIIEGADYMRSSIFPKV